MGGNSACVWGLYAGQDSGAMGMEGGSSGIGYATAHLGTDAAFLGIINLGSDRKEGFTLFLTSCQKDWSLPLLAPKHPSFLCRISAGRLCQHFDLCPSLCPLPLCRMTVPIF